MEAEAESSGGIVMNSNDHLQQYLQSTHHFLLIFFLTFAIQVASQVIFVGRISNTQISSH